MSAFYECQQACWNDNNHRLVIFFVFLTFIHDRQNALCIIRDRQNASLPSTAFKRAGKQYKADFLPLVGRMIFSIPTSVINLDKTHYKLCYTI